MNGVIDRPFLDAQTFGDRDLADELLALFADQCRRVLAGLADTARPASERADFAHTLKGAAAGVGAAEVRSECETVEERLRSGGEADLVPLDGAVSRALDAITRGV